MTIRKKRWNPTDLIEFLLLRQSFDGYEVQIEASGDVGIFPTRDQYPLGSYLSGYVQAETVDGRPVLAVHSSGSLLLVGEIEKACDEMGVKPEAFIATMHPSEQLGQLFQSVARKKERLNFQLLGRDLESDLLSVLVACELVSETDRSALEKEQKGHRDGAGAPSLINLLIQGELLKPRHAQLLVKVHELYYGQAIPFGMLMVAFVDEVDSSGMLTFEESLSVRGYEVE